MRCHGTFTLLCVTVRSLFPFRSLAFRSLPVSFFEVPPLLASYSSLMLSFSHPFLPISVLRPQYSVSAKLQKSGPGGTLTFRASERHYNFLVSLYHHSNYTIGLLLLVLHSTPFLALHYHSTFPLSSTHYYGISDSLQYRYRRRSMQQQ